jgi:SAM-dependent methyltransferase
MVEPRARPGSAAATGSADLARALRSRLIYRFADPAQVAAIQRHHVRFFSRAGAGKVLDLACGRGIFLELLSAAGIAASGVDSNPEAVAECHAKGFTGVAEGDVLEFLAARRAAGSTYTGIYCSHLIEHLPGEHGIELIAAAASVLAPGGRLVVVTPNIANPEVWTRVFWLDPTHQRPYPRLLLETLFEEAGFTIRASFDDPRTRRNYIGRSLWRLPVDLLRHGLGVWSGMDSVVVGEKRDG